jgi:hypothetical protein
MKSWYGEEIVYDAELKTGTVGEEMIGSSSGFGSGLALGWQWLFQGS